MAKRSLKASPDGIKKAKQVFERREWTQEYLASAVGIQTRQPIWKFFTGRPIERYLFIDICFQLDLPWEDIVDRPQFDTSVESEPCGANLVAPDLVIPDLVTSDLATTHLVEFSQFETSRIASSTATVTQAVEVQDIQAIWQVLQPQIYAKLREQYQVVEDLLDIYQSVDFSLIYAELTVTAYKQSRRWLESADLQCQVDYPEQADFREMPFQQQELSVSSPVTLGGGSCPHPNFSQVEESLDFSAVLQQRQRVVLLGEVGAGKSFLLRSIALKAMGSELSTAPTSDTNNPNSSELLLPIYIQLGKLGRSLPKLETRSNLATWLLQCWSSSPPELTETLLYWLLARGKVLLLFDGLDELSLEHQSLINDIIHRLSVQYPDLSIVVAGRMGVLENFYSGFFPVKVMKLNDTQIQRLTEKWFATLTPIVASAQATRVTAKEASNSFLKQLFHKRHRRLHNLARTPLLLHLLCLTFCDRQQLPHTRSRLYEYILEIFLGEWDRTRMIVREVSVFPLSTHDLINIFSQVAFSELESGHFFFEKPKILTILANYIAHKPGAPTQFEQIWQQTHVILDHLIVRYGILVEAAKEIYTFSHQEFQEYLCARYISTTNLILDRQNGVANGGSPHLNCVDLAGQSCSLQSLAKHSLDPRWYEIIWLSLEMLAAQSSWLELQQQQLNQVILNNPRLDRCLQQVDQKAQAVSQQLEQPLEIATLRAFYLGSLMNLGLDLAFSLDQRLIWQLPGPLTRDRNLIQLLNGIHSFAADPTIDRALQISLAIQSLYSQPNSLPALRTYALELAQRIQENTLIDWETLDLQAWAQDCQKAIIQSCDLSLGYDWNWTKSEVILLEKYYWANVFLLECCQKLGHHRQDLIKSDIYLNLLKPCSV